jgi:hypothetical protein
VGLVAFCALAQTRRELLLPEPRYITGVVVDSGGAPVAEVSIDHTNDRQRAHQTSSTGQFALDTRAPALVFRKAGFRSEWVRTKDASQITVTMQKLTGRHELPICLSTGQYERIDGWGASFQFPLIPGVKASAQGQDIDYGVRNYYVHTKPGPKIVNHGSGPLWSFGLPLDTDVWRSVTYEEVRYDVGSVTILNARGQFANGNHWRTLSKFGESASYSDVDETVARILDQFLDGACLSPEIR